jgi:hypothetical protein
MAFLLLADGGVTGRDAEGDAGPEGTAELVRTVDALREAFRGADLTRVQPKRAVRIAISDGSSSDSSAAKREESGGS